MKFFFDKQLKSFGSFILHCFIFLSSFSLFALPIDLSKNWNVTNHWIVKDLPSAPDWIRLDALPLKNVSDKLSFDENKLRYVTLHKTFLISGKDIQETEADAFSLHVPYISNVFEIYLNGERINASGKIENGRIVRSGYRRHIIIPIDRNLIRVGQNEIRILVAAEPGEELDVYLLFNDIPAKIDLASENQKINEEYLTYMLLFLYFFVGVYHGLFYLKRRNEEYNLYYALFAIGLSVYMVFRSQAIYLLELDPYLQSRLEYFVVFFTPIWLPLFADHFFRGKVSRISKYYLYFVIVIAIVQFFVSRSLSIKILLSWQISVLIFALYTVYIMAAAVVAKNKDAYRMFIGFAVLMITGTWDVLGATGLLPIQNLNLLRFGFLTFVLGIAVVLANRFLRVHRQVEVLNATLEKKVEERTKELQNTLSRVQELKTQQDGDYFLTSLLLDPISGTNGESDLLNIQSYTKQKKEFEFRGKKREIGGDIIISDVIFLQGKSYTVFVNGDAMGKSIQGAGGALVLGVVFLSVIKRTQSKEEYRNKSPERWLKECFVELQSIFESFDGSMLISVVLGLVEEETGLLYYVNAEHPWTVLYRDGVAGFIENELELRKIGTKGMEGDIRVRIFSLEKEDVLFVGSDGRDDIVLGSDLNGNRHINEDETQFLRRVEESKGDLKGLLEELSRFGELSDDLTLMRIEWKGEAKRLSRKESFEIAEGEIFPDSEYRRLLDSGNVSSAWEHIRALLDRPSLGKEIQVYLLREAGRVSLLSKNFAYAAETLESVLPYFPTDNEILLQLSFAYRKLKNYEKAINLSERVRSRDPKHFRNLVHLVECYKNIGQLERAKKLFSKLAGLAPEHPQTLKWKEILFG